MLLRHWYPRSLVVLTWGLMTSFLAVRAESAEPKIGHQQAACGQCHAQLAGLRRRCGWRGHHRRAVHTTASSDRLEVKRLQAALSDAHLALISCQSSQQPVLDSRKELVVSNMKSSTKSVSEDAVRTGSENSTIHSKSPFQERHKPPVSLPLTEKNLGSVVDLFLPSSSGSEISSSGDDLSPFVPVIFATAHDVDEDVAKFTPALMDSSSASDGADIFLDVAARASEVNSGDHLPGRSAMSKVIDSPPLPSNAGLSRRRLQNSRGHASGDHPAAKRALKSSSSSQTSGGNEESHGHQYDALLFLFNAIIIGTVILHLTMLPMLEGLQQTVTLFILGVGYSLLQDLLSDYLGVFGKSYYMWMEIDPHTLMFTMLPVLLTGDAMTIDTAIARRVANQCVYLAGPGVLIQAFIIAGFLQLYLPHDWSFLLCLTVGAIFAATDPVAVVGLLKELGASPVLTVQIQGESLLNDGTAIVLYTIAYQMLKGNEYDVGELIIILVKTALCAAGLGAVIGWFFVIWIRSASNRLDHHSCMIQISLTLCCAYWSFIISEGVLKISGVLCTVCSALVMADKMWPSIINKEAMSHVWHMFEYLGNTLIFFLAGALTGNIMTEMPLMDYLHLVVIYLVVFVIRTAVLFISRPILKALNPKREPVSVSEALVMSWGGLRGAVGLALAIQVSIERAGGNLEELDANRVLFYTGGVAALTLTVNATTCPLVVRWLGITQTPWAKRRMMKCIHRQLECLAEAGKHPPPVQKLLHKLLREVHHEMDRVVERSGQMEMKRQSIRASVKNLSLGRSNSRLSTVGWKDDDDPTAAIPEGKLLMRRHKEMKELVKNLPDKVIETGLIEFPEIPYENRTAEMEGLISEHSADPLLVRTVNEAFLSLVRAQYWKSIDAGEFERTTHAELLLSSVTSAYNRAHVSLVDLRFVLKELDSQLARKLGRTGWKAKLRPYHMASVDNFKEEAATGSRAKMEEHPSESWSSMSWGIGKHFSKNGPLARQASAGLAQNDAMSEKPSTKSGGKLSVKSELSRSTSPMSNGGNNAADTANLLAFHIKRTVNDSSMSCALGDSGFTSEGLALSAGGAAGADEIYPQRRSEGRGSRGSRGCASSGLCGGSERADFLFPSEPLQGKVSSTCAAMGSSSRALAVAPSSATYSSGWDNSPDDWFQSSRTAESHNKADSMKREASKNSKKSMVRSFTTKLQESKRAVRRVLPSFRHNRLVKPQDEEQVQLSFVQKVVDSKFFTISLALAIALNAMFIAVEENFRDDSNDDNQVWFIVDTFFLGIFSIEFLFKLAAMKCWYCFDIWNIFDLFLVLLGVMSLVFELMLHMEKRGTDVAGEARLIRLTRVFRVLRILRIFRLAGFYSILKAKIFHQDFSQTVAESLQSVTCLSYYVKAHCKSQEELIRFTGGFEDGQLIVEVARCLIESRTAVYQAFALAVVEAEMMDGETVLAMNMMREANAAADTLSSFVLDAHKSGMLNTREAETFLHPLRHCMHEVLKQRQQSVMGFRRQSTRAVGAQRESLYGVEEILTDAHEHLEHCERIRGSTKTLNSEFETDLTGKRESARDRASTQSGFPILSSCSEDEYVSADAEDPDDPQVAIRNIMKDRRESIDNRRNSVGINDTEQQPLSVVPMMHHVKSENTVS